MLKHGCCFSELVLWLGTCTYIYMCICCVGLECTFCSRLLPWNFIPIAFCCLLGWGFPGGAVQIGLADDVADFIVDTGSVFHP